MDGVARSELMSVTPVGVIRCGGRIVLDERGNVCDPGLGHVDGAARSGLMSVTPVGVIRRGGRIVLDVRGNVCAPGRGQWMVLHDRS